MVSADAALRASLEAAGLAAQADGAVWLVTGNTFAHRDALRRAGGRWDAARRAWQLPSVEALAALAGAATATPPGPSGLAEAASAPSAGSWGSKHYHGHRERLRQRLLEHRAETLPDYELLELILFFSVYRRDTKPLAKELLERFGGLGGVLAAEPERYREVLGLDPARAAEDAERRAVYDDDLKFTTVLLKALHELTIRVVKEPLKDRPVIGSWTALIDYLHTVLAHESREQLRLLFLDRKNILLRDEVQHRGTVDHTPLYPREVVRRALELGASALILVHNHPSGDPTPSKGDIETTRQVAQALKAVDITLHDHVIMGKGRHLSFRAQSLI
jgi:DNA repair protein RadC